MHPLFLGALLWGTLLLRHRVARRGCCLVWRRRNGTGCGRGGRSRWDALLCQPLRFGTARRCGQPLFFYHGIGDARNLPRARGLRQANLLCTVRVCHRGPLCGIVPLLRLGHGGLFGLGALAGKRSLALCLGLLAGKFGLILRLCQAPGFGGLFRFGLLAGKLGLVLCLGQPLFFSQHLGRSTLGLRRTARPLFFRFALRKALCLFQSGLRLLRLGQRLLARLLFCVQARICGGKINDIFCRGY